MTNDSNSQDIFESEAFISQVLLNDVTYKIHDAAAREAINEAREAINELATGNNSVTTNGDATDADLRSCCVMLINGTTGELVDKQPLSRLLELFYNYCTTDKILDLIDAIGTYDAIKFEDANVKALCVENFGGSIIEGEITKYEAAQVTSLGDVFKSNTAITKFNELKYFTGLTTLNAAFKDCTALESLTFPTAPLSGSTCLADCIGRTQVEVVDLRPLNVSQSAAVNIRPHTASSGTIYMREIYFPEMEVRTMYYAFTGWSRLTKIDFSLCDFSGMASAVNSQSSIASAFSTCSSLTTIAGGFQGLGAYNGTGTKFTTQTLSLASCPITHDNAVEILESLGTPPGETASPKITFKASTYNTLTSEEIAIATAKKWQVASA